MQQDLAPLRPDLVNQGLRFLDQWAGEMARTADHGRDPMLTVLRAGGPENTRGYLARYLSRLRSTGRSRWADFLERAHPRETSIPTPAPNRPG